MHIKGITIRRINHWAELAQYGMSEREIRRMVSTHSVAAYSPRLDSIAVLRGLPRGPVTEAVLCHELGHATGQSYQLFRDLEEARASEVARGIIAVRNRPCAQEARKLTQHNRRLFDILYAYWDRRRACGRTLRPGAVAIRTHREVLESCRVHG